jgi:HAD superfamily hydrolase (TIGR01549 family)
MPRAALFDLDDTLLDTAQLRDARERREWDKVLGGLSTVTAFEVEDGQPAVVDLPKEAKNRGLAVGVLTHSPRPYAEALISRHGVRVDELVTGSDGFPAKPDPTGLLALARGLDVEPAQCLYIGDAVGDFGAAAAAGMVSVGVSWKGETPLTWRHGWPDIAIDRPSQLLALLDGANGLRPMGELVAAESEFDLHWGSVLRLGSSVFGLGRYFPTGDPRYVGHSLSHLILDAKEDKEAQQRLAEVFGSLGGRLSNPPALIASVPPSPDKEDRFGPARAALAEGIGARDGGDLLVQLYDAPDYRSTARDARAAKVVDRFAANGTLSGERVILIDDVYTSGSQADACREVLRESGAGRVSVFIAGVTQDGLPEPCPRCGELGGTIKVRRRRADGVEFKACSRYPNCTWTASL